MRPGILPPTPVWCCALSLFLAACAPAQKPAPPASGWEVRKHASWTSKGFEDALDLSGIATLSPKSSLVVSDELYSVQACTVDTVNTALTAGELTPLLANPKGKKLELDLEGIAASPGEGVYYATGSHGVGKKNGNIQEARFGVFRIPVDPATGVVKEAEIQKASLLPWAENSAEFRDYVKKPLQLNGFNIEGLAFKDGKLFFGVRGPNVQGSTWVIETSAAELFKGGTPECTAHELPVGEGRGIRELVPVKEGFLILTGNASAEASKKFPVSQARRADKSFELFLWQPGGKPELSSIGAIPDPADKAEGMLVLEDTEKYVDVLVIFDGAAGGAPTVYRVQRK